MVGSILKMRYMKVATENELRAALPRTSPGRELYDWLKWAARRLDGVPVPNIVLRIEQEAAALAALPPDVALVSDRLAVTPREVDEPLPVPPYNDDRGDLQEAWQRGYRAALALDVEALRQAIEELPSRDFKWRWDDKPWTQVVRLDDVHKAIDRLTAADAGSARKGER